MTHVCAQRICMTCHDIKNKTQIRCGLYFATFKGIDKIAEQPWATQATTANNNAIATSFFHHAQCIFCFPHIAVTKHRNSGDFALQLCNGIPACCSGVVLLGRARMQGNCCHAFFGSNDTGLEVRDDVVINANAELACHRNAIRRSRRYSRAHNGSQQIALDGHCGATAFASHLVGRTPKVHVNVINQFF